MNEQVKANAAEVKRHVTGGDWAIGFLIAKSVFAGKATDKANSEASELGKIPVVAFAIECGLGDKTVTQYLKTWDNAAAVGLVPSSNALNPGDEVTFDDRHTSEIWLSHYPHETNDRLPGRIKGLGGKKLEESVNAIVSDPAILAAVVEKIAADPVKVEQVAAKVEENRPTHPPVPVTKANYKLWSARLVSEIENRLEPFFKMPREDFDPALRARVYQDLTNIAEQAANARDLFKTIDLDAELSNLLGEK